MRKLIFFALAVLLASPSFAQVKFFARRAAGGGGSAQPSPASTGGSAVQDFNVAATNTGTVSSTIDVPDDADFMLVGISNSSGTANFYSGGSMAMTKGGSQVAMTTAVTGANGADNNSSWWQVALYYMVAPDTGSNKTLTWDWVGSGTPNHPGVISVTFWKDVNQSTPIRDVEAYQDTSIGDTPYTTSPDTVDVEGSDDLVVAWVGAFADGDSTCLTWTNLTAYSSPTANDVSDGAWATAEPTTDQVYACETSDTDWDDGGIIAVSLRPD